MNKPFCIELLKHAKNSDEKIAEELYDVIPKNVWASLTIVLIKGVLKEHNQPDDFQSIRSAIGAGINELQSLYESNLK